jgi:hypothetical protein
MKYIKGIFILVLFLSLLATNASSDALVEVDKGKVPKKFLKKSVKKLPNGIKIWDERESISQLNRKNRRILWVDTRPSSMWRSGTIKGSVNLVYHKNEKFLFSREQKKLTKNSLNRLRRGKTKIVYFCQGPKCHRSYNAALRSVQKWGLPVSQVVWLRAGYPLIYKHIQSNPRLKRKIGKYLQGSTIK